MDFHSSGDLLLVAGEDKYMRFFKVDGEKNEKQLSVRLNDMSIQNAVFRNTYSSSIKGGSSGASEVVACGRKPFFYSYDTVSGNVAKIPGNFELIFFLILNGFTFVHPQLVSVLIYLSNQVF